MSKQTYARQAIEVRTLGPTNTRGARAVARCEAGRLTVAWDDGLDAFGNARAAALALAKRLGWDGPWIGGGTRAGWVFVDAGHVS